MQRLDELDKLKHDYLSWAQGNGNADLCVFGEGDINADIMLIGEAPGAQEVRLGRPFVGQAGENLSEFLAFLGLQRDAIYITNAVKFRPCAQGARPGTLKNRPPSTREIAQSREFLLREIELIMPRLVVTLGNVPLKALCGNKSAVGAVHGQLEHMPSFALFPLYHPASIIYNQALKAVYRQDLAELKQIINSTHVKI